MYAKVKSKILIPATLDELFSIMSKISNYKIIAGGTDLLIKIKQSNEKYDYLVNILRIKELKNLSEDNNYIYIGATLTFSEILENPIINGFEALYNALKSIGSPQIRNMGTIGGNIINASPAADSIPPLLLYDAEVKIISNNNSRWESLNKKVNLKEKEILAEVRFKKITGKSDYIKIGKRKVMTIARLNLAYLKENNKQWRFSSGAMTPYPLRMKNLENICNLKNYSDSEIFKAIEDDIFSKTSYRPSFDYKLPVLKDLIINILRENQ